MCSSSVCFKKFFMSADVDGASVFFIREKFCAETLNFIPSSFFVELFLFFFFVALIKSSCFNDETTEDDVCCCFCEE